MIDPAAGRWPEILQAIAGLTPDQLINKKQPCPNPSCGGTDRYRWRSDDGRGSFYCSQCGGRKGTGGGGTGIGLLMRVTGQSYADAKSAVEAYLNIPSLTANARPIKTPKKPYRQPERPPSDAPPPPLDRGAVAQWVYRDSSGAQLFWVQRIPLSNGKKAYLHRVWLDNAWHRPSRNDSFTCEWPAPRPLYNLPDLAQRPAAMVLLVEGEKTATAAANLFPEQVVVTWPNGAKAINKIDWSPLSGRDCYLWPDADNDGADAMATVAAHLLQQQCTVSIVAPPSTTPSDWDLADAPAASGWDLGDSTNWTPDQAWDYLAKNAHEIELPATATPTATPTTTPPAQPPQPPTQPPAAATAQQPQPTDPFKILGFDGDHYFYHALTTGQVVKLSRSAHTATNLFALAPLPYWETLYPGQRGANWNMAASDLITRAGTIGPYDSARIRGRGAWFDHHRSVLHLGDTLIVDGISQSVLEPFNSRHNYLNLTPIDGPAGATPLSDQDAYKTLELAQRFRWGVPASGMLLAGWCALAPICGALRWRPHIWLTAGAGSGKSEILNRFIMPLLGDFAITIEGATTEAGIRQGLNSDALPVVFDEAESNERTDKLRMQGILALARIASTESSARILKGSANGEVTRYTIRSMFLLSSISTALKQGADKSRFAQLTLRPNDAAEDAARRQAEWKVLKGDLTATVTLEYAASLQARTVSLIPQIRASVEIFTDAAASYFNSQRLGDQYGTLLAGAWSLMSSEVATPADALGFIQSADWSIYSEPTETPDELRCIQAILQHPIRVELEPGSTTRTIGELVDLAAMRANEMIITSTLAQTLLNRHGLRVDVDRLMVSNNSTALARILSDTPWSHSWNQILLRLPGAYRLGMTRFSGAGGRARAVSLSLTDL